MSHETPRSDGRRSRAELIAAYDRETRRMGSMATLHNHAVAAAIGLHVTDHDCLDLLDWAGPLAAGDIANHLGMSTGAVTALVDRLESGGWVRRERDASDRRRVIVHLAGERTAEMAPIYEPLARAVGRYRDELSAEALRAVVDFLEFANATLAETTRRTRERR